MKYSRVAAVFFSPTGNTRMIAREIGGQMARLLLIPFQELNFTTPPMRQGQHLFSPNDLVVFATPVYAGRVPNKILPYVREGFSGNGASAVPVVTFGNRSFGDALMELRNELEHNGFHTIAGAAFVTGHAFSDKLSPGRPDEQDMEVLGEFVRRTAQKAAALTAPPAPVHVAGSSPVGPYYTPLGLDGRPVQFLKAVPKTAGERCTNCGTCAQVCPMGSIRVEAPWDAAGLCIKCHACVRACPSGAKFFDDPSMRSHLAMLERHLTRRQDSVYFL